MEPWLCAFLLRSWLSPSPPAFCSGSVSDCLFIRPANTHCSWRRRDVLSEKNLEGRQGRRRGFSAAAGAAGAIHFCPACFCYCCVGGHGRMPPPPPLHPPPLPARIKPLTAPSYFPRMRGITSEAGADDKGKHCRTAEPLSSSVGGHHIVAFRL